MSKIAEAFEGGKAFIAFITCGDPDIASTVSFVTAAAEAGADIIEIGIPFSDPTAEGPVIEAANMRSLAAGTTTDKVFEAVREIRKTVKIPLIFMTYANVVFSYGTERFARAAAEVGMDGVILPDVPYEEKEEFAPVFRRYGLDFISLIASTSHERISMISRDAEGFVYCVSSLGATGTREHITADISEMTELVHAAKKIPVAAGFDMSSSKQAREVAGHTDGVIVSSAIMELIEKYGTEAAPYIRAFVSEMKAAVREAEREK